MSALGIADYVVIGTLLLLIWQAPRLYALVDSVRSSRRVEDEEPEPNASSLAAEPAVAPPPATARTTTFAPNGHPAAPNAQRSMRYTADEVLTGVLATFDGEALPGEEAALAGAFNDAGVGLPLLDPLAGADGVTLAGVLERLRNDGLLQRVDDRYVLNATGREHAVSRKRTLFNADDCRQLERAAALLSGRWPRTSIFERPSS